MMIEPINPLASMILTLFSKIPLEKLSEKRSIVNKAQELFAIVSQ